MTSRPKIPVVRHYDQQHLSTIALPLGGIGTGTVALGGRGDLAADLAGGEGAVRSVAGKKRLCSHCA